MLHLKKKNPDKSWWSSRQQCFWKVVNKPSLSFWQNVQDEWHKRFWVLIAKINLVVFNIISPIRIVEHLAPPFLQHVVADGPCSLIVYKYVTVDCTMAQEHVWRFDFPSKDIVTNLMLQTRAMPIKLHQQILVS